jgi:hypothetical protein
MKGSNRSVNQLPGALPPAVQPAASPAPAQSLSSDSQASLWVPPGTAPLTAVEQLALLDALLAAADFDEALRLSRQSRGSVLAELARNPDFADEWGRVAKVRLAEVHQRLVDKVVKGLSPLADPSDARDKLTIGLAQAMLEAAAAGRTYADRIAPERQASSDEGDKAGTDAAHNARIADILARAALRLDEADGLGAAGGNCPATP